MKIIQGDLIALAKQGMFDVIIHGCNCQCTMGSGVAKQIKDEFPLAYEVDLTTMKGDRRKLGSFTQCGISYNDHAFYVVNAYTQLSYSYQGKCEVDYDAIDKVFHKIKQEFSGKKIAYPMIGAGRGGGDWSLISETIDNRLEGEDHTLVQYKKENK